MKVILLQDVAKTGRKYDLKDVSDGYALNFLIPNKLAKTATTNAIKELDSLIKKQQEIRKIEEENLVKNIKGLRDSEINLIVKANEEGHLFAKVDKKEIVAAVKDQKSLDINPDSIILEKPLKEVGGHTIEVKVNDSTTTFKLNITSEK